MTAPNSDNPRNPGHGSAAPGSSAENAANLGSTSASGNAAPSHDDSGTSDPRPAPQKSPQKPDGAQYGRDETLRNPNIDPAPEGGSGDLEPGETPPESNSATASPPAPAPSKPPRSKAVITAVIIAIVLLLGLVFVGYAVGLLD